MKIKPRLKLLSLISLMIVQATVAVSANKERVIIDADTGNEMDDLYAVLQALSSDSIDVRAVTSAHFNNPQLLTDDYWHIYPTKGINTVEISQELNEAIISGLGIEGLPLPLGCDRMVGYAWGYYEGAPIPNAPAVDFIISEARNTPEGEKLGIVVLGPVTNVAAAILRAPDIAEKLKCYVLGMRYDFETGAWNKNTFNTRNDINGTDILLDCEALELVVIPGNVSRNLVFDREQTLEKLAGNHPVLEMLSKRWDEVSAGESWIMWDLALVQYVIDNSIAETVIVSSPPENVQREITVLKSIDTESIKASFWETVQHLKE